MHNSDSQVSGEVVSGRQTTWRQSFFLAASSLLLFFHGQQ